MAFWPFRKRSKTNSGEKRTGPIPESEPGMEILQDFKESSSIRNTNGAGSKRNVSKRSSRLIHHIQSFTTTPTIEDFPLPPNVASSSSRIVPEEKPIRTAQAQDKDQQRSESSGSSYRPHKRNVFRRTSQRFSNTQVTRLRDIAGNENGPLSPASNIDNPFLSSEEKALEARFNVPEQSGASKTIKHKRAFSEKAKERANPRDSVLSTSSEHSSLRAFRVRSLDVLSPRPKLRFAESPPLSDMHKYPTFEDMKGGYEWRSALRLPINEEPISMKKNRVYGLADALDSRGIRDALERDARRKERKAREDEARAQAKLERKAEKQRADAEEATRQLDSVLLKRQQEADILNSAEAAKVVVGVLHDAVLPSETLEDIRPTTSDSKEVSAGTRTPMSWVQDVSQENVAKQPKKPLALDLKHKKDISQSSQETSIHYSPDSDYPDETKIETARAVRLSTCTVSPPPSPSLVRSPTLIHHTPSHSRHPSRDVSQDINALAAKPTQDEALASAWGSFFKKATNARIQKEHETAAEAYRTPPPEDREIIANQAPSTPTPATTRNVKQLPTPEQSQLSLSQEQTTEQSTQPDDHLHEHPGPLSSVGMTSLNRTRTDSRTPSSHKITSPAIPNSPGKSEPEQSNHSSKHFSSISYYNNPSSSKSSLNERTSGMARSMASLESEGSWLSGRLNSRQSFSPIRNSAASLRNRYRGIEGHEDKRASVADDEYFSGVPRQSDDENAVNDSEEEELSILDNYTNDEIDSQSQIPVIQPVPIRQTAMLPPGVAAAKIEDGQTFKIEEDRGTWREGLGRRPTITRVDSALARRRERLADVYQAQESKTFGSVNKLDRHPLYPMQGEVFSADELPDFADRGRDSPSPTLGRDIAM